MDRLSKLYILLSWWLGYISSPWQTSKFSFPTLPMIFNIFHSLSMLVTVIDNVLAIHSTKYLPSAYMLVMVTGGVDMVTTTLVRLLFARFSSDFLHTWRQFERFSSAEQSKRRVKKTVGVAMALAFGSSLLSLYAFSFLTVERLLTGQFVGLLKNQPALAIAQSFFSLVTQVTAIPFALSFVVIISAEIVNAYESLCNSLKHLQMTAQEMWELKRRFKCLKRQTKKFESSANYFCLCIVATCAAVLLQMLGIVATQDDDSAVVDGQLLLYILINLILLSLLACAGNVLKTEVSIFRCY